MKPSAVYLISGQSERERKRGRKRHPLLIIRRIHSFWSGRDWSPGTFRTKETLPDVAQVSSHQTHLTRRNDERERERKRKAENKYPSITVPIKSGNHSADAPPPKTSGAIIRIRKTSKTE